MLFMGEEWGSKAPFPFFCDFKGDLADAVRKGRRSEFAWAYAEYGDEVPDALAPTTFRIGGARLGRAQRARGPEAAGAGAASCSRSGGERSCRAWRAPPSAKRTRPSNGLLTADWRMGDGATLRLLANLSDQEIGQSIGRSQGNPDLGQRVE